MDLRRSFNQLAQQNIDRYLQSSDDLSAFCTQNGFVDPQTLHFDVLSHHEGWVIVAVEFMEVVEADSREHLSNRPCFGRLELRLDTQTERVVEAYVL